MVDVKSILAQCQKLDDEGRVDDSVKMLSDAIAISPSSRLYYARGLRFQDNNQNDLAMDDFTQAIQMEPKPIYLSARGLLLSDRLSKHELALQDFKQALLIDPCNPLSHLDIAFCYLVMGCLGEAFEYARSAVELAPNEELAHICLGQCLIAAKRPVEAAEEFRIAISLDPTAEGSWRNLAEALQLIGHFREAKVCIERAIELERSAGNLIYHAGLLLKLNEPLLALGALGGVRDQNLTKKERYLAEAYHEEANRMLTSQ